MFPVVPIIVIITEFKIYLGKGSQESPKSAERLVKLSKVGFLGKSLGGNINNSLRGLNAFENTNIGVGKTLTHFVSTEDNGYIDFSFIIKEG